MLNTDSPVPLYFQLYGIIRKKIESKAFLEGEKIPSENELATTFGIGRPTVRQACERLIRDGLLEKRKGSGTYVRSGRKAVSIFSIAGTSAAFSEQGLVVTQRIVDPLSLSEIPSVPDNPFSGEVAYFFSRASLYEDEPVLLELIYLDRELFAGLENYELTGHSLARIIEDYFFMRPVSGHQNLSVSFLKGKYASSLGVSGRTPLLHAKRRLHFKQKENAVYSEMYARTDRFEFSQDLGGNTDE
jgi:GntR family transcriptional regulator